MAHNTLIFQHANPLQQLTGLARAMALPHEFAPTRFPSFPALERTAVIGFNTPTTFSTAGSVRAMVCRQAAYPLWIDQAAVNPYSYSLYANTSGSIERIAHGSENNLRVNWNSYNTGTVAAGTNTLTGVTGTLAPPNGYPMLALDAETGPYEWFYIPVGGRMAVVVRTDGGTPPASDPQYLVTFERWSAPGETTMSQPDATAPLEVQLAWTGATMAGIGITPISLRAGWYRPVKGAAVNSAYVTTNANFSLQVVVTGAVTVTVTTAATAGIMPGITCTTPTTGLWPVGPPPEYTVSTLPFNSTRTTAAACLFTNVTKVLNKEGTIMCGRLSPQNNDVWNAVPATLAALHPAEKEQLAMEQGAYTFCPPSTDLAKFWDYSLVLGGIGAGLGAIPIYRLDNDSLVNMLVFIDPDGATPTTLAVNLDWHLEFRTTSSLFQVGMSTNTLETLHQSQLVLCSTGFFFNNSDHKSILESVMPKVKSAAKMLVPALETMFPHHSAMIKAGRLLLSNKPKPTVKATSGEKSGMSTKPKPAKHAGKGKGKSKKGKK